MYRIFQSQYFLEDAQNSQISLVNIHPLVFGDPYENPLLNKRFKDENGDWLTLNGIVEHYYGLSWTEEEKDEKWRWEAFTHRKLGVRVRVSLLKLMDKITNLEDDFFMLHYFVGKVSYHDVSELDDWVTNSHYTNFLDSQGHLSSFSLTKLRNDFDDEKEVRILYSYMPNDNDFVRNRIVLFGAFPNIICKHPFEWREVVQEVLLDSRMSDKEFEDYKDGLINSGISCKIERSSVVL